MANIEISTLTRNNDGNTYIIKDANAIPKSGGVMTGHFLCRDNSTSNLNIYGGNGWDMGAAIIAFGKDNPNAGGYIRLIATNGTDKCEFILTPQGTLSWSGTSIVPANNNACDLGTSTNKWKSINGIAPDELGLPTSTYTDVLSYITNFDSTPNTFTAPVSGLLFIEGTNSTPPECTIHNNTKQYRMTVPYAFYNIRGLFPVEKGDSISVYISRPITAVARIYHLKGKV